MHKHAAMVKIYLNGEKQCCAPKGLVKLTSASAFTTRFCVKFYATLLRNLCRVVTLRSYISGVSRSERGFNALFQVSARPHGVAGKLKINRKHEVEIVTSTGMQFRRKVMQLFWSSQYILNYSNLFFWSEIAASFHVVSGRWISHPDSHPERLRLNQRHPSAMEISAIFMMFNFANSVFE